MKFFTCLMILFFLNSAFAKVCEVYGISDGPQKLNCTFPKLDVNLTCRNGDYFLNSGRVSSAWHLEVEEGPTPLVFKSAAMEMTVVIESKTDIQAELIHEGRHFSGSCL